MYTGCSCRVQWAVLYDGIQSQEFRHVIKTFYIDKTDFTVQYISLQYHRYYKKIVYLLYNVEKMQFMASEELSTWFQPCMIAFALAGRPRTCAFDTIKSRDPPSTKRQTSLTKNRTVLVHTSYIQEKSILHISTTKSIHSSSQLPSTFRTFNRRWKY